MNKKIIAPIVIGVLVCLYYLYLLVIGISLSSVFGVFLSIFTICIIATIIYVVRERINEIKGGEEDDLSKY